MNYTNCVSESDLAGMAGVECLLCHLVLPASTTDLFASHLQVHHLYLKVHKV